MAKMALSSLQLYRLPPHPLKLNTTSHRRHRFAHSSTSSLSFINGARATRRRVLSSAKTSSSPSSSLYNTRTREIEAVEEDFHPVNIAEDVTQVSLLHICSSYFTHLLFLFFNL